MTISEMIRQVADSKTQQEKITANYEVFKALLESGEIYIVCKPGTKPEEFENGNAMPYTAGLEDKPFFYTRIFSERTFAENYAEHIGAKSPDGQLYVVKFNQFQLCALAKDAFIGGIDGFLLNEGDCWTTMRCDGLMKLFLVDISNKPDMYNQSYVNTANVIHDIARRGVLYSAAIYKGSDGKGHALTLNDALARPISGNTHGKKVCNLVLQEQRDKLLGYASKKSEATLIELPMPVFYAFIVELYQKREADEIAFVGEKGSICAPVAGILGMLKQMPYAGLARPVY